MENYPADAEWWKKVSIKDFCIQAGLGDETTALLLIVEHYYYDVPKDEKVFACAWDELSRTVGLTWKPLDYVKSVLAEDNNLFIKTYVSIRREFNKPKSTTQEEIRHRLSSMFPIPSKKHEQIDFSTAALAFEGMEKPSRNGEYPSETTLSVLVKQCSSYHPSNYYSPYTTIVGPSGIGKTFFVKQLAVRHGIYVAYSNFSREGSQGYPRPVKMGLIPAIGTREAMVAKWQVYITNQVRLVDYCKAVGLTAPGLLELLTSNRSELIEKRQELGALFDNNGDIAIDFQEDTIRNLLAPIKTLLESLGINKQPLLPPKPGDRGCPTILCFDEARNLLNPEHSDGVFRSLREAAKSLATGSAYYKAEMANFFLVLLDTTSKIGNFTPSNRHDPSSKASNTDLFHPIHQIDTLDVFAPPNPLDPSDTLDDVKNLFSYGRPLWGAFFIAGHTAESLLDFAIKKISGYRNENLSNYGIALLTYRMDFYISSPAVAENLVASMMRYIVSISGDRSSLITTQPSEPILAFAASRILQDPAIRLSCIKSWIGGLHSGAVNPGDIGEQVASLVLLFAFDYAARPADNLPHAIPLQDFLAALLGDRVWRDISLSFSGTTTQSLLRKGRVFFNHFVRTTQKPTLEDLEGAYRRGFAIFLPPNFTGMDIGIPVRMPTGRMALLLLQIKNRKASSPTPGLKMLITEDLHKARKALNLPDLHGIVGLVMCLRSRDKPQRVILKSERPPGRITRKMSAENAKGKGKGKGKALRNPESESESEPESESADLLGMVFGLDTTVYPCLRWTAKPERSKFVEAEPELEEMCELLRRLLETWPIAYADKDTKSDYAKRLLDPFF